MSDQRWHEVPVALDTGAEATAWLAEQMSAEIPWLLVHADDGVIWGRLTAGNLELSSGAFDARVFPSLSATLRVETMLQARIFGPAGELFIWRDGAGFRARRILDGAVAAADAWDEAQILWGTRVNGNATFTVLREGRQGPVHAVPMVVPERRRAALTVRHYVATDPNGQAYVGLSRLVQLGLYNDEDRKR